MKPVRKDVLNTSLTEDDREESMRKRAYHRPQFSDFGTVRNVTQTTGFDPGGDVDGYVT
jgi:hypothetical protein